MKLKELKGLVKLATDLDGRGLYSEADEIDLFISKFSSEIKKKKRPILFSAVKLTDESKAELFKWWKDKVGEILGERIGKHMTIAFKPSIEDVQKLPLGEGVDLQIVGWAQDDNAQTVVVKTDKVGSANEFPHITVAVSSGTNPKYSNDLLNSGPYTKVDGPTLKGEVVIFNGKEYTSDLSESLP